MLTCGAESRQGIGYKARGSLPFMHELALSESLLALIEESARTRGFRRVRRVRVEVGLLSSVHKPSLNMCFDAASRGTIAEGALLEIIDITGCGTCVDCGKHVEMTRFPATCTYCGGKRVAIRSGTKMRLKDLVVE